MTRKEFVKMCSLLGIGIPLQATIKGCSKEEADGIKFDGKVLIIGAGAGGLATGYFLQQQGIEFEILEASNLYGGRMRINDDFANFPIPLGAEWLHSSETVFQEIVNDSSISVDVTTIGYDSRQDTNAIWQAGKLNVVQVEDSDRKFVNYTWFNFFEDYILPSVKDKIRYNTIIKTVNYSEDQIVAFADDESFSADKIVIAVPLKILQEKDIEFIPALPSKKREAIDELKVWDGFKAFVEFSEKFYHTATGFDITPETDGQKLYYDASYGQETDQNILGLFVVGKPAQPYISRSGDELKEYILKELDEIYDGQASMNYVKHITQNWNSEPFIKGAYLTDHENWRRVRTLSEPIDDKIFFAGGPYSDGEDWVAVHAAAQSAKRAVESII